LYACEGWSPTLREENRLKEFEIRVLRRISEPKREKVARGWRRLHDEELHNLYASPNIIIISRMMNLVGHVACIGEMRNAYSILTGKPGGKKPLGDLQCG
jgi:hypothetical protein